MGLMSLSTFKVRNRISWGCRSIVCRVLSNRFLKCSTWIAHVTKSHFWNHHCSWGTLRGSPLPTDLHPRPRTYLIFKDTCITPMAFFLSCFQNYVFMNLFRYNFRYPWTLHPSTPTPALNWTQRNCVWIRKGAALQFPLEDKKDYSQKY
jgi:hypothetical protein